MKTIVLILKINDEGYTEDEIIQNIICSIPNRIAISMKEVIENSSSISEESIKNINEIFLKSKEQIEYENGKSEDYT